MVDNNTKITLEKFMKQENNYFRFFFKFFIIKIMIIIVLDIMNPVESINTSVNEPTLPGTNN